MTKEQLIKKVKKEVEKMKPETTAEAKSYFHSVWRKYAKKGIYPPAIYYPGGRG